jgi:hypothetical protein
MSLILTPNPFLNTIASESKARARKRFLVLFLSRALRTQHPLFSLIIKYLE